MRSELLAPTGLSSDGKRFLRDRGGWSEERIDLLDEGFGRYWARAEALARRALEIAPPRLRNIAIVHDPSAVRPFGQMLNQSTWTMYDVDFDAEESSAELVAYLLVHGDRMAQVGEVTFAAVHLAPYWFERSAVERQAFARAAERSTRPDAALLRSIAAALPWLRELRHAQARPPRRPGGHRPIPGTGLLVPKPLEREPERLVEDAQAAAVAALEGFYSRWRAPDERARTELIGWLASETPPLLVTSRDRILWDPERPAETDAIDGALAGAGAAALHDMRADLAVVAARTRRFLASLVDPAGLPTPRPDVEQGGYVYTHRSRRLLAYDLNEPNTDRLLGPALPYARAMLGARAIHEWAHLAVEAGWVPRTIGNSDWTTAVEALAAELDAAISHAPREVRSRGERALLGLGGDGSPGSRLAAVFVSRLPDYQSNLLAMRFWEPAERETYVHQNIRPLRAEYPPERIWSMLVRYLYEFQYLAFSDIADKRRYFVTVTWFEREFLHGRIIDESRFDALCRAAAVVCQAHAVDEARFRFA